MANGLIPRNFWSLPSLRMHSLVEDLLDATVLDTIPSGLSVSEDDNLVYVEAALPGIDPRNIEVTFENGVLYIRGEAKDEERQKKYYRKATSSFSYRILIPGEVSLKVEPTATYKNGMMRVVFKKTAPSKPKRIEVKTG